MTMSAMILLLIHVLSVIFSTAFCAPWSRIADVPNDAKHISVKNNEIWAITKKNQVVRWYNEDRGWQDMGYAGAQVAASPDGHTWIITEDGPCSFSNLALYDPSKKIWETINGCATSISAQSASDLLLIMDGMVKRLIDGEWRRLSKEDDGNHLQVALGENDEIWKVNLNNGLYRFDNGEWKYQKDRDAKYVDVHSATRVVVVDPGNQVWLFDGRWHSMNNPPGIPTPNCDEASVNRDAVFCVDRDGKIWRRDVN